MRPVEHRVEAADDHRVREAPERLGLLAEIAQRDRILHLVGTEHLGDRHGEELVVPDEPDLVAVAAAEVAQHGASRRDRVSLGERPARTVAGREWSRGSHGVAEATPWRAGCRRGERRYPAAAERRVLPGELRADGGAAGH